MCMSSAAPPPLTPPGCVCTNTCIGGTWGSDGFCDDGGPSALYSACALGTDCTLFAATFYSNAHDLPDDNKCTLLILSGEDCQARCNLHPQPPPRPPKLPPSAPPRPSRPPPSLPPSSPPPLSPSCVCTNECIGQPTWSSDGFCDDGGIGSASSGCAAGTDCDDW